MEEIELKSFVQALILRNKGYKFKHIKTGSACYNNRRKDYCC